MQPNSTRAPADRPDRSSLSLVELFGALRQRAALFLGVTAGVTVAVISLTLLIPPAWESDASVRIRMQQQEGLGASMMSGLSEMGGDLTEALPGGLSLPGGLGESDVTTEIGVLGSLRILDPLAESLALHVTLQRPWRAFRTNVLDVLHAGEDAPRGTYTLRRQSDGTYTVRARGTREAVELPERVRIGEPFDIGPMRFRLEDTLAADPPRVVRFKVDPYRRMMRGLRKRVKVERSDQGSRLVAVSYRNSDPYLAQALVNGIVDDFLDYSLSTSQSDSRRQVGILRDEVEQYRHLLSEAENRLQTFQESARIIAPEEQAIQQVQRIAGVQVRVDAARVERASLAQVLQALEEREPVSPGDTPYRALASFPSFLTNPGVQQFLTVLTNLENRRAELLVQRTEANQDVRALTERIRDIERQLHGMATDYLEGLDTQIAASEVELRGFGAEVEAIPAIELEYARLMRERRLLTEVYLMLQSRLANSEVQLAMDDAQARIVDRGIIEDRPAFPRRAITFPLAGMMGLMIALFTVVATETQKPSVRTRRDAELATGSRVLARVPHVKELRSARQKGGTPLFVRHQPESRASEAVRALALALRSGDDAPRVVVVASPDRGDGRSTLAANVSLALARQGARTALVEGDLRHGTLDRWFGSPSPTGGRVEEGRTGGYLDLVRVDDDGGERLHPLEVLASDRVPALVDALRASHDVVVIDTPSLETGHDAGLMAGWSDGVILVARPGVTEQDALAAAAEALGGQTRVLGVVLNDARA